MAHRTPVVPSDSILRKIRDYLRYEPDTGHLIWIKSPAIRVKPGDEAGAIVDRRGGMQYRIMTVTSDNGKQKSLLVHHVVYYLREGCWPPSQLDHRDRDGTNNRWNNLRLASDSQNMCNRGIRRDNKTGTTGVWFSHSSNKYVASIDVEKKTFFLGHYKTLEDAVAARKAAEIKYHGEFCPT